MAERSDRLVLAALLVFSWPSGAGAAEVQQVRGADLLQVGDGNRSYSVELVCLKIDPDQRPAAEAWLRERLPRRTRVNLRPMGQRQGVLLARVSRLDSDSDLSSGLIAAGLAQPDSCPGDPIGAVVPQGRMSRSGVGGESESNGQGHRVGAQPAAGGSLPGNGGMGRRSRRREPRAGPGPGGHPDGRGAAGPAAARGAGPDGEEAPTPEDTQTQQEN
jgi:hypothetical protein